MEGEKKTIEYNIVKSKQYYIDGDIQNMKQQSGNGWTLKTPAKSVLLQLNFLSHSIVHEAQFKISSAHIIQICLFDQSNKQIEKHKQILKNLEKKCIAFPKSKQKSIKSKRATIQLLSSFDEEEKLGLKYLMFRGIKSNDRNIERQIINIQEGYQRKFHPQNDDINFKEANKSPHIHPPFKSKRDKQVLFDNRKKAGSSNDQEKQQYDRAIRESLKQAEKSKKGYQRDQKLFDEELKHDEIEPRSYATQDYQKVKNVFKFVNSNWIQAQRKAEIDRNIRQNQKLSSRLTVLVLYNKIICIDVANQKQKTNLQKIAAQLGAKVVGQPTDNCLIIASKSDSEKVKKGKKLKNIKILNQQYLSNCKTCSAALDERDYFMKL